MPYISYLLPYFIPPHTLTQVEQDLFDSMLRVTRVRRKQFVEQPGYVSTNRSYVVKGAFRSFLLDLNGHEQTVSMAVEGGWVGDPGSFLLQEPATLFVEALEDSTLLQWSYASEQVLVESIPTYTRLMLQKTQLIALMMQRRLLSSLTLSAEQRYDEFAQSYPQFVQRMPLYVIASYLGMTREFLSKIRNQKISPKSCKE